ncbi:MAG: hypothetical protein K0U98_25375 [Deltaproteobacteria bacterium]|nr:hypothetical protein [Deltaproteobacteria bacterium]
MSRWIVGCLLAILLVPAAPLFAGVVYVPLAMDSDVQGNTFRTQVWISNEGLERRRAETYMIAENSDGTIRDEPTTGAVAVPASSTTIMSDLVSGNAVGMLELTLPPQLSAQARLIGENEGVANLGAAMPVISSDNIVEAGDIVHLQPWVRSSSRYSDLVVVNLGQMPASCSIGLFKGGGSQIGTDSVVTLQPLSMRHFPDVLGILGQDVLGSGRSEVSCDQPFYAFGATFDTRNGDVVTSLPAGPGNSSLLRPDQIPQPGACPEFAECFDIAGDFFTSVRGEDKKRFIVPVTKNTSFSRLVVEVDFAHGGWFSRNPEGIHNIFYLTRTGGYSSHTYGFVTTRGPGRDFVRNEVTVDLPRGENQKMTQGAVLQPGTTYHVRYVYNAVSRVIDVTVTERFSGRTVVDMSESLAKRIRTFGGTWFITFSDFEAEAHVPSRNWTYSNLSVQFIP